MGGGGKWFISWGEQLSGLRARGGVQAWWAWVGGRRGEMQETAVLSSRELFDGCGEKR